MPEIKLLTQDTIDKIAAGEVVDRPSSIVKELTENAIDAGATAVTVEIKEGGINLIRISDNGCGIDASQIRLAFQRHSTSKIRKIEDLISVSSLGFRGEALSSIAAIARVELITKTADNPIASRYLIEGSKEIALEETAAPNGTTFLIKDIFYNTPARRKFLKSPQTEGNYISDIVERLALSHPDISFRFINNGNTKLHTSGNGSVKDVIYNIYGRDITGELLDLEYKSDYFKVKGFIGKPIITRGNRNYETYFINGRYIKSAMLSKAIEEAYKKFIMLHQYPFCVLYFEFPDNTLDVNVHPSKMEIRFDHNLEVYRLLFSCIEERLMNRDLIPKVPIDDTASRKEETFISSKLPLSNELSKSALKEEEKRIVSSLDRPLETKKNDHVKAESFNNKVSVVSKSQGTGPGIITFNKANNTLSESVDKSDREVKPEPTAEVRKIAVDNYNRNVIEKAKTGQVQIKEDIPEIKRLIEGEGAIPDTLGKYEEITLADISPDFLAKEARSNHKIIGQLFNTYWLIEYDEKLYIIDQHAAHEKVLYERFMDRIRKKEHTSQLLNPPIIITLDVAEQEALEKYQDSLSELGYVVEPFGGKEFKISAVPGNLYKLDLKDLFIELLDDFSNMSGKETPQLIIDKIATMSCKAAIKGNNKLSMAEIEELISELLTLENPYNCPHGRPTIISMTKYEIEKKFKRIV